jgi:hypothetical protein
VFGAGSVLILLVMVTCQRPVLTLSGVSAAAIRTVIQTRTAAGTIILLIYFPFVEVFEWDCYSQILIFLQLSAQEISD